MKALVLHAPNTPFSLETVPDPEPGPSEAVVKVLACGSGLTIQHMKAGRGSIEYPRIIGHELTGEIIALGSGVKRLAIGDAVTAYFYLSCGHCRWCLTNRETLCENLGGNVGRDCDGGYAEYMKLPAKNFIKLPEGLDWRTYPAEIAVITDAIATPWKVIRRGRVSATDTVVVFGAGGGLGIHMLMMAKWAHARVIAVEIRPEKFEACRAAGADYVVDGGRNDVLEALQDITGGKGADVTIDFVGTDTTLRTAAEALGRGGRMVMMAGEGELRIPGQIFRGKEAEILGSRYCTKQEVADALNIVARGQVWPLVTEIGTMEDAEAIHERVAQGKVTGRAALRITP